MISAIIKKTSFLILDHFQLKNHHEILREQHQQKTPGKSCQLTYDTL